MPYLAEAIITIVLTMSIVILLSKVLLNFINEVYSKVQVLEEIAEEHSKKISELKSLQAENQEKSSSLLKETTNKIISAEKEATNQLLQINKYQAETLTDNIDSTRNKLSMQSKELDNKISETTATLAANYQEIKQSQDSISKVLQEQNDTAQEVTKNTSDALELINKNVKEVQTGLTTVAIETSQDVNDHLDKIEQLNRDSLSSLKRCESKGAETQGATKQLITKLNSVEDAVYEVLNDSDELKKILKALSALENNLKQEIQKGFASKNEVRNVQTISRATATTPTVSREQPKQVNQTRIEKIEDKKTHNIVRNHYNKGQLVKSEMSNSSGQLIYVLEYANGKISRSLNYGTNGALTNEQIYYDNGQVHYRKEYDKSQKVNITEFDRKGFKIKR